MRGIWMALSIVLLRAHPGKCVWATAEYDRPIFPFSAVKVLKISLQFRYAGQGSGVRDELMLLPRQICCTRSLNCSQHIGEARVALRVA